MSDDVLTRRCTLCGLEKPLLTAFHRDGKGAHGRSARCVACARVKAQRARAQAAARRQEHRERYWITR